MMGVGKTGMKDYVTKNLKTDPKGTYRDKDGRLKDSSTNKYVTDPNSKSKTTSKKPDVDLPDGKNDKWWKKMPKIKGGGGALAAVMGLFTLGSILADDEMSKDEKIVDGTGAAAGTVGGVGGAWAGASAGAMVGAMGGPIGAAIGGILGSLIGGTLGYMAGDTVGSAAAGAVVGDVIDEDNGKVPGAVIGGMLGAKDAEGKMTKTLATVCKTETRKKSTSVNEYSHSTITFEYDGIMYELDFIKRQ